MALGRYSGSIPVPRGGVNNTDDIFSIARDEVYRAVNYRLNQDGVFESRRGSRRLNSTAVDGGSAITSIYQYRHPDGSGRVDEVLVTAGKNLYRYNEDTNTVTLIRTLESDVRPSWVTFGNTTGGSVALMANGTDFIAYDGFSAPDVTYVTGQTNPRYLMVYDDRVLAAGQDSSPYRVYISNTFDGTDWMYGDPDAGHYWLMSGVSGDRVTGLGTMYSFGVIFQQFGVTIITEADVDSETSEQIQVAKNYGTTSHWSIQTVGNTIYFAGATDIYRGVLRDAVENGMVVEPISDKIRRQYRLTKTVGDIISVYDPTFEEIQWACDTGVATRKKDTIFAYSVGNSGTVYSGGGYRDVWAGWFEGFVPNALAVVLDGSSRPVIWRGDNVGFVYKMYEARQYTDEGSDGNDDYIVTEIVTAPYAPRGATIQKRLRSFTPIAFQRYDASLDCNWLIDGTYIKPATGRAVSLYNRVPYWRDTTDTQRAQLWDSTVWSSRPYTIRPVTANEPFRYVQFIFTCDGTNATDETAYAGMEVTYQVHGPKHAQG